MDFNSQPLLTLSGKTFYVASLEDWCENIIREKTYSESVNFIIYPEFRKNNRAPPFGILILNGIDMAPFDKIILKEESTKIHGPQTIDHRSEGVDGWYHNMGAFASKAGHLLVFWKMAKHVNINESSGYDSYPLCGQSFVFANEKIDFNIDDYELIYLEHRCGENFNAKYFKIRRGDRLLGIILFIGGQELNVACMFRQHQLNYVEFATSGSICLTNTYLSTLLDVLIELY